MSERPAAQAALLTAVALAAYLPALAGSFHFDDFNVIVDNAQVHGLRAWWQSMPGIRALLKLSYALNWTVSPAPFGFHAVNVLIHCVNVLLVHALVRQVAGDCAERTRSVLPLAAALLFALHPAQTEAVSYVAGRSVSMMALFYLAALLTHLHFGSRPGRMRAVSPALFALALATRETAWTLPLAIALLQRFEGTDRSAWRGTGGHWGVLAAAALGAFAVPGYRRLLDGSLSARSLWDNLLTQIDGIWYLIAMPLLALHTNIDPDLPVHHAAEPLLLLRGAALLALVAVGFVLLRQRSWWGLGILWFFLHLAPTNSVLPRLDVANDRHLYLAMLGPALMVAAPLTRQSTIARRAVLTALVTVLALASVLRNLDYRSEQVLWSATVRASPHKARAWNNLGYAHALAGDTRAARAAYERALRLDPGHAKAAANLHALDELSSPR